MTTTIFSQPMQKKEAPGERSAAWVEIRLDPRGTFEVVHTKCVTLSNKSSRQDAEVLGENLPPKTAILTAVRIVNASQAEGWQIFNGFPDEKIQLLEYAATEYGIRPARPQSSSIRRAALLGLVAIHN
jgi:hypothetical protein